MQARNDVAMLIMTGGPRGSDLERMVTQACEAATLDKVERALAAPAISRVIVATNSGPLADRLGSLPVVVDLDPPGRRFHFGRRLLELIERHRIERLLYFGGGSGVLLPASELDRMARALAAADRLAILNNFYSADFAGWTPASCIRDLLAPRFDNELGWILGELAQLPLAVLDRSAATQFDIDTPTDLLTVSVHPEVGPHLRAHLDSLRLSEERLDRVLQVLNDPGCEVIVAGRIGAAAWSYLENETACRTRVFSEERGMRADGRLFRGEVRSLLGAVLEGAGLRAGFDLLGQLGQAAIVDSRVLWAHFAHWPSPSDRFASDLGRLGLIEDAWLRDFTQAALSAPIPVVLGGHSLVAGGLYALVESALARAESRPRRPSAPAQPDPLAPWLA